MDQTVPSPSIWLYLSEDWCCLLLFLTGGLTTGKNTRAHWFPSRKLQHHLSSVKTQQLTVTINQWNCCCRPGKKPSKRSSWHLWRLIGLGLIPQPFAGDDPCMWMNSPDVNGSSHYLSRINQRRCSFVLWTAMELRIAERLNRRNRGRDNEQSCPC